MWEYRISYIQNLDLDYLASLNVNPDSEEEDPHLAPHLLEISEANQPVTDPARRRSLQTTLHAWRSSSGSKSKGFIRPKPQRFERNHYYNVPVDSEDVKWYLVNDK